MAALHDVALPRSWFINLMRPNLNLRKETSAFFTLVANLIDLMQRIDAHASGVEEPFIVDGSRMTDLTGSLCVARM
jgi:hypothetical protein